jgi:hypothetical protein
VRVPTWGWPDHNDPERPETFDPLKATRLNPAKPPDWRWRVKPLLDQRPDGDRPEPIQLLALDDADVEAKLSDPATILEGYQKVAARHQHALGRLRNARQILFRGNVGRLRFEAHADGRLDAIHEVYTAFSNPDVPAVVSPKVEPYLVQVASLGPEVEEPPTRLRRKAIEIPPAGAR